MTLQEFTQLKERVSWGEEFQICYRGQLFWISQNREGFYLTRVKDAFAQKFTTANGLFENATIDSKFIKHIWNEIEWT